MKYVKLFVLVAGVVMLSSTSAMALGRRGGCCGSSCGPTGCADVNGKPIARLHRHTPSRTAVDFNGDVWVASGVGWLQRLRENKLQRVKPDQELVRLVRALTELGADVRWASCNIYSTQDHAAAAIAANGTPVFAYKGESLDEYWEFTHRIFEWPNGQHANMILDDGGDATLLMHLGKRAERDASVIASGTSLGKVGGNTLTLESPQTYTGATVGEDAITACYDANGAPPNSSTH